MSEHELKPCPFCGGDLVGHWTQNSCIVCHHCGAEGPVLEGHAMSHLSSSAAWNTRATPPEVAERAEARVAELEAEVGRLMAEIAELDFLRHEGGSDSVSAMEAMLRGAVLPILRAYAEDLLRCVSVGNDPATIAGADWRDIADVLDAVCEAERFVGRPDDEYGALLNPVLDARTWEYHR